MRPNHSKREMLVAMAAAGAALLAQSAQSAQSASRSAKKSSDFLPDFEMQTHEGKKVRLYSDLIKGKKVIINTMYAACTDRCPLNTANLREVQRLLGKRLGRDVFMYSITLRSEFDTPAALAAYVKQYEIGPGWTYLTGKHEEIEIVRRRLGFYDLDPEVDADPSQHSGLVRIGNVPLDRWCAVPSLAPPSQIVTAIDNI